MAESGARQGSSTGTRMGRRTKRRALYLYVNRIDPLCQCSLSYPDAATDAAVALAIYHRMMSVKILSNARPRLWIFSGYDACSREAVGLVKDYAPYAALSTQCITSMEGLLAKMKRRHQDADNTLPGDDFHTWTEKTIPEAVKLCASLTMAFDVYNRQMSVRKDS